MAFVRMDIWKGSRQYLQIYKLPQSSLAELARNSVRQSGFEMEVKRHWLGHEWYLPGAAGNEINKVKWFLPRPPRYWNLRSIHFNTDKRSWYQASLPTPDPAGWTWYDTRKSLRERFYADDWIFMGKIKVWGGKGFSCYILDVVVAAKIFDMGYSDAALPIFWSFKLYSY